jgi:AbrB family looped-hinge helix DNA binding protein
MVSQRKRKTHDERTIPSEVVLAAATVTSKGQITIPKSLRERLFLGAGDRVEFVEVNGCIVLRKEFDPAVFDKWRGHAKWLKGVDVDAFVDEMRGH